MSNWFYCLLLSLVCWLLDSQVQRILRSGPGWSGDFQHCGTTQTVSYDENGYPASRTDYRGTMTLYEHNERGLETNRIEAAGTDLERTINTQWHPDFRLPVMISVPGRITTFIYDHRGLLFERIERAAQ